MPCARLVSVGFLRMIRTLIFVSCMSALACGRPTPTVTPDVAGPVITALDPSSGPAGTSYPIRITILGHGFDPTGNLVEFAGIAVQDLASVDGSRIELFLPKERPSSGEVPPMPLLPGRYDVTVSTSQGLSAPSIFTLTRGAGDQ